MRFGYASCPECGVLVPLPDLDAHECARDQWTAYQVIKLRGEIERIDAELFEYLETAHGRFDAWYAERTR